jgi:hypothetical protein
MSGCARTGAVVNSFRKVWKVVLHSSRGEAYHGQLVRARAARGKDGARGKMEASMVRRNGRNGSADDGAWWRRRDYGCCCCWLAAVRRGEGNGGGSEGGRARGGSRRVRRDAGATGGRVARGVGDVRPRGGRLLPRRHGVARAGGRRQARTREAGLGRLREQAEAEAVAR